MLIRRHVYRDLQPYICLTTHCSLGLQSFESRHEWGAHTFTMHKEVDVSRPTLQGTCPFCHMNPGPAKARFISHVGRHMQDVSLSAIPMSAMSREVEDSESGGDGDESVESEDTADGPRQPSIPPGFLRSPPINMDLSRRRMIGDIIQSLQPPDHFSEHKFSCKTHFTKTCQWLLTNNNFNDWLLQPKSLLWVHGSRKSDSSFSCGRRS